MEALNHETISGLARHTGWPSISIQMPTHRIAPESLQDPIRLKNLLRITEETLREAGTRPADIDTLLKPARDLFADPAFWREPADGLAVFIAEDFLLTLRVGISLPEQTLVSERFFIRSLLPAVDDGECFYILALSKKQVRFFEGTRTEVHELDLAGAPDSLADALKYDDYERQVQFHTRTASSAAGRARRDAVFHGHGGAPDVEKDNLLRYFRMVAKGVHEFLRDENAPLLLAGVEYLLPIYREANTYPNLVDPAMPGNPDELTPAEIHTAALATLQPYFDAPFEKEYAALQERAESAEAPRAIADIVAAATDGRVRTLFLGQGPSPWGRYDPQGGTVTVNETPGRDDWDLADLAASETILHGGTVYTVVQAEDAALPAALLRY